MNLSAAAGFPWFLSCYKFFFRLLLLFLGRVESDEVGKKGLGVSGKGKRSRRMLVCFLSLCLFLLLCSLISHRVPLHRQFPVGCERRDGEVLKGFVSKHGVKKGKEKQREARSMLLLSSFSALFFRPLTLLQLGVIGLFVHSEDAVVVGAHRVARGGDSRL